MPRILLSLLFAFAIIYTSAAIDRALGMDAIGYTIDREPPQEWPTFDWRRTPPPQRLINNVPPSSMPDLSGEWEVLEVEDGKRYKATLDKDGNGPYSQQGGQFTTTKYADRLWQGTWQQSGNDREGGFEILLAEDGTRAKGRWWYSRVGSQKNIPPREYGGTYQWKRLTSVPTSR